MRLGYRFPFHIAGIKCDRGGNVHNFFNSCAIVLQLPSESGKSINATYLL